MPTRWTAGRAGGRSAPLHVVAELLEPLVLPLVARGGRIAERESSRVARALHDPGRHRRGSGAGARIRRVRGAGVGERAVVMGRAVRTSIARAGREMGVTFSGTEGRADWAASAGADDRGAALRSEVRSVNGILGPGLSFRIERAGCPPGRRAARLTAPGGPSARGVLAHASGGRIRVSQRHRVALLEGHRGRLLSLAGCLAECAMDLGLGAAVCAGAAATARRAVSDTPAETA